MDLASPGGEGDPCDPLVVAFFGRATFTSTTNVMRGSGGRFIPAGFLANRSRLVPIDLEDGVLRASVLFLAILVAALSFRLRASFNAMRRLLTSVGRSSDGSSFSSLGEPFFDESVPESRVPCDCCVKVFCPGESWPFVVRVENLA